MTHPENTVEILIHFSLCSEFLKDLHAISPMAVSHHDLCADKEAASIPPSAPPVLHLQDGDHDADSTLKDCCKDPIKIIYVTYIMCMCTYIKRVCESVHLKRSYEEGSSTVPSAAGPE